jgi:DNA-binding transcriptional LysR family regulator
MEIVEIEAFLTLAEKLHFGHTAEQIGVTTGRVSQLISRLERRVGADLFARTSRAVHLTPIGSQFRDEMLPAYQDLLAAFDAARDAARTVTGEIRIGFTPTTYGDRSTAIIKAYQLANPGCEVLEREVDIASPYARLRNGTIDVLINWLLVSDSDLRSGPTIDRQSRVLAVAADSPLARRSSLHMEVLADQRVAQFDGLPSKIATRFLPERTRGGRTIQRHEQTARTVWEIYAQVARGRIVHPTVSSQADRWRSEDVVFVPITDMAPVPLGLIWSAAHETARTRAFVELAARYHPCLPHVGATHDVLGGSSAGA